MKIKTFSEINNSLLCDLKALEKEIFKNTTESFFDKDKKKYQSSPLCLVAYDNEKPIAFKIGYKLSDSVFYSWLGGVLPSYRNQGLAKLLMQKQHEQLKSAGYHFVRTSSRNKFKSMLILNLKMGFDITGTQLKKPNDLSILLEKELVD